MVSEGTLQKPYKKTCMGVGLSQIAESNLRQNRESRFLSGFSAPFPGLERA
jgi:hypothetical protein